MGDNVQGELSQKAFTERAKVQEGNPSTFFIPEWDMLPEVSGEATSTATGRFLVLFRRDAVQEGITALNNGAGLQIASTADLETAAADTEWVSEGAGLVFPQLGVAIINTDPDQMRSLEATSHDQDSILVIEPERMVHALTDCDWRGPALPNAPALPLDAVIPTGFQFGPDYLRGYRDGVVHLVDRLLTPDLPSPPTPAQTASGLWNEAQHTWGLQATNVVNSRYSGQGIRIAILDTGFDVQHPDFVGRRVISQSFVSGQSVQDAAGHGTHCIGTACGPLLSSVSPRYGIAYGAEIYAAKVLSDQGRGGDASILAGIEWALTHKCQVISMSLGAPTRPGDQFSRIFEAAAQRALADGTLIIAAAGNNSDRRVHSVRPITHPANCPSIMAVAALDPNLQEAYFSNAGSTAGGGKIDLAAPGVNVRSSWPVQITPGQYKTISGTSMATPHVAGIAALHSEATGAKGAALWSLLTRTARALPLLGTNAGAGLVQAP